MDARNGTGLLEEQTCPRSNAARYNAMVQDEQVKAPPIPKRSSATKTRQGKTWSISFKTRLPRKIGADSTSCKQTIPKQRVVL